MRNHPWPRLLRILFAASLVLIVIQFPAFALETKTAVFNPTDDAYVDTSAGGSNFASQPTLQVSFTLVSGGESGLRLVRVAYLKFNMSVPQGAVIRSAVLKVFVTDAITKTSILIVLPVNDTSWTENSLTGKTAPGVPASEEEGKKKALDDLKITKSKEWYSLNVTSYARSVRSGLIAFMLVGGNTEDPFRAIVSFYSKDSPDPAFHPSLDITYSTSQGGDGGGPRLVYLTLRSSVSGGFVYVNATEYKFPSDPEIVLDVSTGRVKVAVSSNVSISDKAKALFEKWDDGSTENPREITLKKDLTLTARYVESYYLEATTQYGTTTGTGWYKKGSSATFTISGDSNANPPRVTAEGVLGMLGVSYVFDHWSGYSGASSKLRIVVNGPVIVTAIWREDYSLLYSNLIRAAISLGVGLAAAIIVARTVTGRRERAGMEPHPRESRISLPSRRRRETPPRAAPAAPARSEPAAKTPPLTPKRHPQIVPQSTATTSPSAPPVKTPSPTPEMPPQAAAPPVETAIPSVRRQKFCRECGTEIPRDSKYCEKCGKGLVWEGSDSRS